MAKYTVLLLRDKGTGDPFGVRIVESNRVIIVEEYNGTRQTNPWYPECQAETDSEYLARKFATYLSTRHFFLQSSLPSTPALVAASVVSSSKPLNSLMDVFCAACSSPEFVQIKLIGVSGSKKQYPTKRPQAIPLYPPYAPYNCWSIQILEEAPDSYGSLFFRWYIQTCMNANPATSPKKAAPPLKKILQQTPGRATGRLKQTATFPPGAPWPVSWEGETFTFFDDEDVPRKKKPSENSEKTTVTFEVMLWNKSIGCFLHEVGEDIEVEPSVAENPEGTFFVDYFGKRYHVEKVDMNGFSNPRIYLR